MNHRRKLIGALGAAALQAPFAAIAQTTPAAPRVVLLIAGSVRTQSDRVDAFRKRLRELGYVEGNNLTLEIRELDGRFDQLPAMMQAIVESKPAVIVLHGAAAARAARALTSTIPIVLAIIGDPVKEGFAASFARPGGNLTGNSMILGLSVEKTMEILHEIVPRAARAGLLIDPQVPTYEVNKKLFEAAAAKRRLTPVYLHASSLPELPQAFAAGVAQRIDMLVVESLELFTVNPKLIVDLAARHRLPAIYSVDSFVASGALVVYGYNTAHFFANAAVFVDRILKGRKPAELPFEQPTQIDMVLNMKTANSLGLKIPQTVLIRANRVIE